MDYSVQQTPAVIYVFLLVKHFYSPADSSNCYKYKRIYIINPLTFQRTLAKKF
jgi:hypothetical protein